MPKPLSPDILHKMDGCWRAANYLSVGQIYLPHAQLPTPQPCRKSGMAVGGLSAGMFSAVRWASRMRTVPARAKARAQG